LVILPGPQGSGAAEQDFESDVAIFRMRTDVGQSFLSLLGNGRLIDGGGHNAVFGPDFQWRPTPQATLTGQALWSSSETPNRPDLAAEWDGRTLEDEALQLRASYSNSTIDLYTQGQDVGPEFRADQGFMPQVGYREIYGEGGITVRPKDKFFSRIRTFSYGWYDQDYDEELLSQRISVGMGMDGRFNSFLRFEANWDDIAVGNEVFQRFRPYVYVQSSPGRVLNNVSIEAFLGEEIDFANAREGTGTTLNGSLTLRPIDRFELRANASTRWLNVDDPVLGEGRLFLAQVERLRAAWSFSSRSFVRLIGQYVQTERDPSLYTFPVSEKDADFGFSALFAYKVNWQTVLYLGYGDQQTYADSGQGMEASGRQAFMKLSYALQR
jgi:hypothetical protein